MPSAVRVMDQVALVNGSLIVKGLLHRVEDKGRSQSKFGAGALNTRFTLSRGQGGDVSGTVVLTTLPRTAPRMPVCFIPCPTGFFHMKCPERASLHGAAREFKTLASELMPCLADPVDLVILIPVQLVLGAQLHVTLMPRRSFGRISQARRTVAICPLSEHCLAMPCRSAGCNGCYRARLRFTRALMLQHHSDRPRADLRFSRVRCRAAASNDLALCFFRNHSPYLG